MQEKEDEESMTEDDAMTRSAWRRADIDREQRQEVLYRGLLVLAIVACVAVFMWMSSTM